MFNIKGNMVRLTHEKFLEKVRNANPNVEVCGNYTIMKDHIATRCKICGYEWEPPAEKLTLGRGCPMCANAATSKRCRKSQDEFISEVHSRFPNIEVLSEYATYRGKVDCRCKIDGYTWKASVKSLLGGTAGCPKCAHIRHRTPEEFVEDMGSVNSDIDILTDFKFAQEKVACRCKRDGFVWKATPCNLLNGKGCPVCSESKGEKAIRKWLDERGYDFESQKSFDGLVGVFGKPLSYDFYIPCENTLIEFQGRQHEIPVNFEGFGEAYAKSRFETQVEHDKRKREFANASSINLLEIWYWDFKNISSILAEKLGQKQI